MSGSQESLMYEGVQGVKAITLTAKRKKQIYQAVKKYQTSHREQIRKYNKEYRERNKERRKENLKKWRSENKEKIKSSHKEWLKAHPDAVKKHNKTYRDAHSEKLLEKTRKWRKDNPQCFKEIRDRANAKRRSTFKGRITDSMSQMINYSLHGNKAGRKWESLVGYTFEQLKVHLEKLFKTGMTFANYGKWQIDHKIPIAAFNFNTTEDIDFRRCWSLNNLQPLWAIENQRKNDKLENSFQPSLLLQIVERLKQ